MIYLFFFSVQKDHSGSVSFMHVLAFCVSSFGNDRFSFEMLVFSFFPTPYKSSFSLKIINIFSHMPQYFLELLLLF